MHGHSDLARGVISLDERLHQFVLGHAPVVERGVIIRLQLIAHRPHHHAWMATVALDELFNMIHPQIVEMCSSAAYILVIPFVVELIHNEDTVFVAEVEE